MLTQIIPVHFLLLQQLAYLYSQAKNLVLFYLSHIFYPQFLLVIFSDFGKKNNLKFLSKKLSLTSKTSLLNYQIFGEILGNAIKSSISNIISIGGFIVLFSVILSILNTAGIINFLSTFFYLFNIPIEISSALLTGFIELTNGVYLSFNLYENYHLLSILITSFLLGFGGFSILLQVYSIISKENISIKPYILGKFLHGIFSIIFTFILL